MSATHKPEEIIQAKYRITGILGRGGVAITYRAIDLETNSPVAIKAISLKQLDNWKQVELFQREAEVLKQLNHPRIPDYLDYFDVETETDKAFYLVQQLAPGKSLQQLVESGWRTNEKEVKQIAQQVLEMLAYLHSLDPPVIHRDIKPSNLIRSDEGKIYLVDFGAVQNTYYNTLMQGSTVVGTYGYMSPEQFRGQAFPATDLYSLGATLLYLLTHRSPAELPQDTLKLDFRNSVNISEGFSDWLEQILEPDVEDRFSNADVALAELFKTKKKTSKKIIVALLAVTLMLGSAFSARHYKWLLLSFIGFYPQNVCSSEVLELFLEQGGILNSVNKKDKICILSNSIQNDEIEIIENKIKQVKNIKNIINNPDYNHKTLLHDAVIRGDLNIVDLIIKYGGDIEIKNNLQISYREKLSKNLEKLLFQSIYKEKTNIIRLTVNLGADLKDTNGSRLLIYAVRKEDLDLIKLAIANGADAQHENKYTRKTPLLEAAKKNNVNIMRLLIENNKNTNAKDKQGKTPLFYISSLNAAKLLIENGANVRAKDNDGNTALFYSSSLDMAKLLIKNGADVNTKNAKEKTSLFYQVKKDNYDVVKLLIDSGADVSIQDIYGNTALGNAVSAKVAKLLIDNNASIFAKDRDGATHFFKIASRSNLELVQLLIDRGVNVNAKNKHGQTALFWVSSERVAKLLVAKGASINVKTNTNLTPLLNVLLAGHNDVANFLIKRGADINARDREGQTPLFYAADDAGGINTIKLLINAGVNVNARDNDNRTPLFHAVRATNNVAIIKLLIESGADINARDNEGLTPLLYSAYLKNIETSKFLIKSGANINIRSNNGESILHIAAVNSDLELASLLIEHGADIDSVNLKDINKLYKLIPKQSREVKHFLNQF